MSKITELLPILGTETETRDLFVTVNLRDGDLGTKNITRKELVAALQQEVFDSINITGGSIAGTPISNSTISNSIINTSTLTNPTINTGNLSGVTISANSVITATGLSNVTISTSSVSNTAITQSTISNTDISDSRADDIDITDSSIDQSVFTNGSIFNTSITDGTATDLALIDPDFDFTSFYSSPIANDDFFILKDVSTDQTVKILFSDLQNEFADVFKKANKIYVASDGDNSIANGSYFRPYGTLEAAFGAANAVGTPVSITVLPGTYYTNGNLALPDNSSIIGSNGQYSTNVVMNDGSETNNCILVGSGGYVQGLAFNNLQVDNFDNPTGGFAVAFRPGALILRSPYIRDVSQISNYRRQNIAAPLNPRNSLGTLADLGGDDFPNPLVGRGGGVLLADRAVLNQNSIFPYMLAFGATPRSPNGLGYVAKNGAGINGIGSITIFQRCAFYALNGGQITLNNSGTQFGDISMHARGSTPIVNPYEVSNTNLLIEGEVLADSIRDNSNNIIDYMWSALEDDLGYQGYDSVKCKRDVGYILDGVQRDLALATNYWAVTSGIAYRRSVSSVVIDEQLTETVGAIDFLKTSVATLLSDAPSITRTNASFTETIDILENGIANADTVTFTDTGVTNYTNARLQLQNNKALIQTNLIDWITDTFPSLVYDEDLCIRDSGFILDGLMHDLNYGGNLATRVNAEAYFLGSTSQLPEGQRLPTAAAIDYLGNLCAQAILKTLPDQNASATAGSQEEANRVVQLTGIISNVIVKNTLGVLPIATNPDYNWVASNFITSKDLIETNRSSLTSSVIAFINDTYDFIDENFTRRDAGNLLSSLAFDFQSGGQTSMRNFVAGFFDFKGDHVFRVFKSTVAGLIYKGSVASIGDLPATGNTINDAYIVYTASTNIYAGNIYYWDGSAWILAGANDNSIMDSFIYAYDKIKEYIEDNLSITTQELDMLDALLNDVLKATLQNPTRLNFGSLIESIGHQFNLAGAGVNKNALPLNFRRVGQPRSAVGSVLQENGGRVRFSGADELNNQYFARGLKVNGRTGRLEGRPFTSSVRRLARRAANSRTST
jgi:hypothetical protein